MKQVVIRTFCQWKVMFYPHIPWSNYREPWSLHNLAEQRNLLYLNQKFFLQNAIKQTLYSFPTKSRIGIWIKSCRTTPYYLCRGQRCMSFLWHIRKRRTSWTKVKSENDVKILPTSFPPRVLPYAQQHPASQKMGGVQERIIWRAGEFFRHYRSLQEHPPSPLRNGQRGEKIPIWCEYLG